MSGTNGDPIVILMLERVEIDLASVGSLTCVVPCSTARAS